MKKVSIVCFFFLVTFLSSCESNELNTEFTPSCSTEQFIQEKLINDQNMIQTDLQAQKDVYLSESLGLWLSYLLDIGDQSRFKEQVDVLQKNFIKNNLIVWRIDGNQPATVTALIDDLRIIQTLFIAGDEFSEEKYTKLAKKLSKQLLKHGEVKGIYVDFVDIHSYEKPSTITLSYISPKAYDLFYTHQLLTNAQVEKQLKLLKDIPISEQGYWPKSYTITDEIYHYDRELHLIDQLYIGIHLAQLDENTDDFTKWILNLYEHDQKLYGRYYANTNEPAVNFESPAVYALAVQYMLEIGEDEYASTFYTQMKELKNVEWQGYIDSNTQATHSFDNLLPLLVERKIDCASDDEE